MPTKKKTSPPGARILIPLPGERNEQMDPRINAPPGRKYAPTPKPKPKKKKA